MPDELTSASSEALELPEPLIKLSDPWDKDPNEPTSTPLTVPQLEYEYEPYNRETCPYVTQSWEILAPGQIKLNNTQFEIHYNRNRFHVTPNDSHFVVKHPYRNDKWYATLDMAKDQALTYAHEMIAMGIQP